ncbi:Gfo/Idh/MocA family oxidoreductase [Balneolales bacterium ANBcel1]|nr:Gfo/Idh/MocA family oxidoreductase [Balneolales bacterium ANBcel1]
MTQSRKDFLKYAGLAGVALTSACTTAAGSIVNAGKPQKSLAIDRKWKGYTQQFNMAGYAAPALDKVRIGVIGTGSRGRSNTGRFARIEGAEIIALCDLKKDAVTKTVAELADINRTISPDTYYGREDIWKELCMRDDLDLIIINTPWQQHAAQAIFAMEQGKHVATEIPAAQTLGECWKLVETSERTRMHCLQMTNVCYGFFEMVTLNMARAGFFGDIIHGEGAYIHQLMDYNFSTNQYQNMWRLRENATRNGNLYPHHGLGTVAQIMDINHGDMMDFMVSVSGDDFMMKKKARELAKDEPAFAPFTDKSFRGNMNVTIIKTKKGRTITLQHDVTSPRPYTRNHFVSGTKAAARAYPKPQIGDDYNSGWFSESRFNEVQEKFTPEITKRVGEMARRVGGHGGMDTILAWRLIDCLRNGIPLDMNVYDAALWSAVIPMSEWSVANNGVPVDFPDFTAGSWKNNSQGMDIQLEQGGTTAFL